MIDKNIAAELNFNHPVKELVFQAHTNDVVATAGIRETALTGENVLLKLNGHDRFSSRPIGYFCQTQVWQHHTGTPVTAPAAATNAPHGAGNASVNEIGVYSFALKPEEHQPSGTCNFSRIDSAQFELTNAAAGNATPITLQMYAVNYNVLRIMSGMGGLAYSN